jgi:hypothetical protein
MELKMIKDLLALIQLKMSFEEKDSKKQRNLIDDFVEPVFAVFKKVNDDYVVTFRKYKDQIESNNPLQLSLIVQLIQADSLFSQHVRDELSSSLSPQNALLSEFVGGISRYLEFPSIACSQSLQLWSNIRRSGLIDILNKIDQLTPEMIANTLLIDDINSVIQSQKIRLRGASNHETLEYLLASLDRIIIDDRYKKTSATNFSNNKLEMTVEIKRYLAIACIEFIIQETQNNFSSVSNSYWQLKFKLLRLEEDV